MTLWHSAFLIAKNRNNIYLCLFSSFEANWRYEIWSQYGEENINLG